MPETVEHVFMMCRKFNRERVLIKRKIEDSGERFIFRDILSKASDHGVIKCMFEFLKNTRLIDRLSGLFFVFVFLVACRLHYSQRCKP